MAARPRFALILGLVMDLTLKLFWQGDYILTYCLYVLSPMHCTGTHKKRKLIKSSSVFVRPPNQIKTNFAPARNGRNLLLCSIISVYAIN